MNTFLHLLDQKTVENNSTLCIGLDVGTNVYHPLDEMWRVIDATYDKVCAYKINPAFLLRWRGTYVHVEDMLINISRYIHDRNIPVIFDVKYGDVFHTNVAYAEYTFNGTLWDAVTVNPLCGMRALEPFFEYKKQVFIWADMSDRGDSWDGGSLFTFENDFVDLTLEIIDEVSRKRREAGLIIGAQPYGIGSALYARENMPSDTPILIPGVGAQGGNIEKVQELYADPNPRVLVSVSRSIIEADDMRKAAEEYRSKLWYG